MNELANDVLVDSHSEVGTRPDLRVMLDAQRQTCPVVREGDGSVTLLAHFDVRAAALDAETFSSAVSAHRALPNSLDGAEHRAYRPGDDIRFMDWKILGRTDRYYVKQFEEETNLRSMIIVDSSASMSYASKGNISKFEYASYLAGALSYLMMKQQDAVGLALYDTEIRTFLPPRSKPSYIQEVLNKINVLGCVYLSFICIMPGLLTSQLNLPFYFGGTSLLILVGVALDTAQQINSYILTQKYEGFLKGKKITSRRVSFN